MTEFNVDNVEKCFESPHLISASNVWKTRVGNLDYQTLTLDVKLIDCDLPGFIAACHTAYDEHRPLSIKPDDLWLLVLQVFAEDVNQHPNLYRNTVLNFQGEEKKKIEIRRDTFGPPGSWANDWMGCIPELIEKVSESVQPKFKGVIANRFSTTTPIHQIAGWVGVMYAFHPYFSYVVRTRCGIPRIRLEGTLQDWESLQTRIKEIVTIMADKNPSRKDWTLKVIGVVDNFVSAVKGNVDVDFFKNFYKREKMSGGDIVSGHINVFFPYKKDLYNKTELVWKFDSNERRADDYPSGMVSVPFIWIYLGSSFQMKFHSGFIGATVSSDGYVQACVDFAVSKD
jgi:hypothetical protein